MRKNGKITGVAMAVAAIAVGGLLAAAPAQADPPRRRIAPPPPPTVHRAAPPHSHAAPPPAPTLRFAPSQPHIAPPHQYRLGLYGHMAYGRGMVVDSVPWGTPASRTGLEPGDVIVRINGRWIQSDHDYFQALRYCGGVCRLLVQDVRGRGLIPVTVYLGGGSGPILYRSQRP